MYARSLSNLALVFVVLYVLLVVSVAIPASLLDPAWINRVTAILINGASMPLLAMLALVTGTRIYPESSLFKARLQLFSKLAAVAALGFLMLIPLNAYTVVLQRNNEPTQLRSLDAAERQLASYRNAAKQAISVADLNGRLQKMGAPQLNPSEASLPLPDLKARLNSAFDQTARQIVDQRKALQASAGWSTKLPEVLRVSIACLALSFGFASFAKLTATGPLLMDRVQANLAKFSPLSLFSLGRDGAIPKMFRSLGKLIRNLQTQYYFNQKRSKRSSSRAKR
jgi:hypothetical protein